MKWVYNIPNANTWREDRTTGIQKILLRPVWVEKDLEYTSGIVELRVTALQFIDELINLKKLDDEEISFFNNIRTEIADKPYYIDEQKLENDEKEYYLNRADLYILQNCNLAKLLQWIKIYLAIQGYPCSVIEETDFDKFAMDVNPILRIFSLDNAKKFETQFGVEWWKTKYTHQSDKELIRTLLQQLYKN